MHNIPPRVSEELLPWMQLTPSHLHYSVNLPRHLLHSTLHMLLGGEGLGHLYIHYTTKGICTPCMIPFEQRNVTGMNNLTFLNLLFIKTKKIT